MQNALYVRISSIVKFWFGLSFSVGVIVWANVCHSHSDSCTDCFASPRGNTGVHTHLLLSLCQHTTSPPFPHTTLTSASLSNGNVVQSEITPHLQQQDQVEVHAAKKCKANHKLWVRQHLWKDSQCLDFRHFSRLVRNVIYPQLLPDPLCHFSILYFSQDSSICCSLCLYKIWGIEIIQARGGEPVAF